MTRRGRRRLLIVLGVLVLAGAGVFGLREFRAQRRASMAEENRARAMELYEARDYEEALVPLSRAVGNDREDIEVLLAFADTRSRLARPAAQHLREALGYYQRVITLAEQATPEQRRTARLRIIEIAPRVGGWEVLGPAAEELLADADRLERSQKRLALRGLVQASRSVRDLSALDRIAEEQGWLADAEAFMAELQADLDAAGSLVRVDAARPDQVRTLAFAMGLARLDPDALGARQIQLASLLDMGLGAAELLPVVRRWRDAWDAAAGGEASDPRYLALEATMLLEADRAGEAATILLDPRIATAIDDDRTLRLVVQTLRGLSSRSLARRSDPAFRATIRGVVDEPDVLSEQLLEQARLVIERTLEANRDAPWAWEVAIRWAFEGSDESGAAELLAEAREDGLVEDDPVLARWAAVIPLIDGDLEAAARATVRLKELASDLGDPAHQAMTEAWGRLLERFLRTTPELAPEIQTALDAAGPGPAVDAAVEAELAVAAEEAEAEAESADEDEDAAAGDPVSEAVQGVILAARTPTFDEPLPSDVPIATYLSARHAAREAAQAAALQRYRTVRQLAPTWPRAAAEEIALLVEAGLAEEAYARIFADQVWWRSARYVPVQQLASALVALGPAGRGAEITLPGVNERGRLNRVELVELGFDVRETWNPQGVRLLVQALAFDEGPDAVAQLAEEALAAESVPTSSLQAIASSVSGRDVTLARRLLERALEAAETPAGRTVIRAELASLDGDVEAAARIFAEATDLDPRTAADFALRAALFRLTEGREGAVEASIEAIGRVSDPGRLGGILDQPLIWQDLSVARAAIDRLAALTGRESTRVLLAEARHRLAQPTESEQERNRLVAEAFSAINAALRQAPDDPRLMRFKAEMLIGELGRTDRARREEGIQLLTQTWERDPVNADVALRLIPLLHQDQRWEEAGRILDRMIARRGSEPSLAGRFAALLAEQGRLREAVEYLRRVPEPTAATRLQLAGLLDRTGQREEAVAVRDELASSPDLDADAAISLAVQRVTAEGRSPADAEAWLVERLAESGDADVASDRLAVARLRARTGRTAEAGEAAIEALERDATHGDALALALTATLDTQGPEAARELARRWLPQVEPSSTLRVALPSVLTAADLERMPAAVRERYAGVVTETSVMADFARLSRAIEAAGRQQAEDPSATLDPAVASEVSDLVRRVPTSIEARQLEVTARLLAGDAAGAVDAGLAALDRFPGDVNLAARTALTASRIGRTADALFAGRAWLERTDGSSLAALDLVAGTLIGEERPEAALAELEGPAGETRRIDLAWAQALQTSLQEPEGREARTVLVRWLAALAATGDRRLRAEADRALDRDVIPPTTVADATLRTPQLETARRYVDRAAAELAALGDEASPGRILSQAGLTQGLAALHADAELAAEAIGLVEPLRDDEQVGPDALVLMAQSHAVRGERSTAIALYRDALERRPDVPLVQNNLAYLLALEGTDCEEANRLADAALAELEARLDAAPVVGLRERSPERAAMLSTVAMARACTGRHDEAVARAEEAVGIAPEMPDLHATLAWTLLQAGDAEGAAGAAATARRLLTGATFPARYRDAVEVVERVEAATG